MQRHKLIPGEHYGIKQFTRAKDIQEAVIRGFSAETGYLANYVEIRLISPGRGQKTEMRIPTRHVVCAWKDVEAYRAKMNAKSVAKQNEQAELDRIGEEIAQRLESMGFKPGSSAGFRQRTIGRGGKRHAQFVVTWELLLQLLGPQSNDDSALATLLGETS
jgi:hypothetical protein